MNSPHTEPAVLLIQLRRLGDVLMLTPAIRALRNSFPGARLDVLTEAPADELLRSNPYVSNVLLLTKRGSATTTLRLLGQLRRARYDFAIDFNGLPSSALLCRASGARRTIGFAIAGRGLLYGQRVPLRPAGYSAQHKLDLLGPLGLNSTDCRLDFFVDESERLWAKRFVSELGLNAHDRLITVSPVSRQPYKVWPPERFATVADHLAAQQANKILFLYGPGERHFAEAVRQRMKAQTLTLDYPMLTLRQTRALFDLVHLHVGNDNGPAHFAIAAGTRTVTIFGRPHAANWTPHGNPVIAALEYDPGCKSACHFPKCRLECLSGVSTDSVIAAAERLLKTAVP